MAISLWDMTLACWVIFTLTIVSWGSALGLCIAFTIICIMESTVLRTKDDTHNLKKPHEYKKIDYVPTKRIPTEIEFKKKDGSSIKIKATKIVASNHGNTKSEEKRCK